MVIFAHLKQKMDYLKYKKILCLKDKHVKDFFNKEGCGLEIEFGVNYEYRCRVYIENGLKKLINVVGTDGKIVEDASVGADMNFEIVLNPLDKDTLHAKFRSIKAILNHYENFIVDDNCGVHATFLANDERKAKIYNMLISGAYKSNMFVHSKYKPDLNKLVLKEDGSKMTFEEYMDYQHTVSYKYVSVNFLKPNLVEFRSLDMDWKKIEYVIDLFDRI